MSEITGMKAQDEKYATRTFMKYSSENLGRDKSGELVLLNCNEAIARGAIEAGVRVITSYPGSPVNYVLDSLAWPKPIFPSMHIEWSSNEKSAFETMIGATLGNVRAMSVFKNTGMNFIADPLLTTTHMGISGAVVVFNDDPNAETTGNTQDSRYIPKYALCPVLEPATMQELKDWIVAAYDLSEILRMTIFVRVRDRTGWGRGPVVLGPIQHDVRERKAVCDTYDVARFHQGYEIPRKKGEDILRIAPYPVWFSTSLRLHNEASQDVINEVGQLPNLRFRDEVAEASPLHLLKLKKNAKTGIITAGCHTLVLEALDVMHLTDEVSVLKLAITNPLPHQLIKTMLEQTSQVLVVEEIEPIIEEGVRSIAAAMPKHAAIFGKLTQHLPTLGEIERNHVGEALEKLTGKKFRPKGSRSRIDEGKKILREEIKFGDPTELSKMCPGCPEYAGLYALKRAAEETNVNILGFGGDGCFDLVMQPPLKLENVVLPLGGSVGGAHGLAMSGIDQVVVALMGDGGFFHHGMVNVVNAVYNKSNLLIVILDNRSVGQTGHQPHPGAFGLTAAYEPTKIMDIVDILKAFQVDYLEVADPFNQAQSREVFSRALKMKGVRVVILRRTCTQIVIRQIGKTIRGVRVLGPQSRVDESRCLAKTVEKSPCEAACPAGIDVEAYIRAIAGRDFQRAIEIIRDKNPFPSVCGRVCNHPCEMACKRGKVDEAIAIMALKRFASDFDLKYGEKKIQPAKRTRQEKIAIVGSGPSGLTAAYDLVRKGYAVTVFESRSYPGGMLTAAIPDFMLPPKTIERDIEFIRQTGVEIRADVTVGEDISLENMFKQGYKAVYFAGGAQKSVSLKLPGAQLKGVMAALPFLQSMKQGKKIKLKGKVVVIGGGNVAVDTARTAVRCGADEVHLACLEDLHSMPAFDGEKRKAMEEGVIFHTGLAPREFISSDKNHVESVLFNRVESTTIDEDGRVCWKLIEESRGKTSLPADTVIIAVGQSTDFEALSGKLKASRRGTVIADAVTLATGIPGVFAGGDAVTGPSTVVEAIGQGHKAADNIDAYLRTGKLLRPSDTTSAPVTGADRIPRDIIHRPRVSMPFLPVTQRVSTFDETETGLTEEMAVGEARRCLNCKTCGICLSKFGCISIAPQMNIDLNKEYPLIEADTCAGCGVCNQVCPYDSIVVQEE
ncbi:MAG: FAD-dependent oxidoreductase [Dehalococcoidia bacterium]|nr:FAD-dependent oxidoreductase [Dehalococcoidia bacterium]